MLILAYIAIGIGTFGFLRKIGAASDATDIGFSLFFSVCWPLFWPLYGFLYYTEMV